ncbi:hypothetical protein ACJJIF_02475 [Microbulbifer sp. SSSA002]|uniref:hypothetical protein n=1 Tax=Microbulbifer sp. SSSA002 TaxID=3243376 RepID=UPI00403A5A4A
MSFRVCELYIVRSKSALIDLLNDDYLKGELSIATVYKSSCHAHHREVHRKRNSIAVKYSHQAEFKNQWEGAEFLSYIFKNGIISESAFDEFWGLEISGNDVLNVEEYFWGDVRSVNLSFLKKSVWRNGL